MRKTGWLLLALTIILLVIAFVANGRSHVTLEIRSPENIKITGVEYSSHYRSSNTIFEGKILVTPGGREYLGFDTSDKNIKLSFTFSLNDIQENASCTLKIASKRCFSEVYISRRGLKCTTCVND